MILSSVLVELDESVVATAGTLGIATFVAPFCLSCP